METTVTLPVTLNGETRDIAFSVCPNGRAFSKYLMIARCGRTGTKKWIANMSAWKQTDGTWRVDYTFYKLNRNTGRVLAWGVA